MDPEYLACLCNETLLWQMQLNYILSS